MSQKGTHSPIAERLSFARKAKGISQKQLGILAGIDEFSASPRINQYEKGKHVPDFATAQRLAEVLSIPVTYLYADEDEMAKFIWLFFKANNAEQEQVISILKGPRNK